MPVYPPFDHPVVPFGAMTAYLVVIAILYQWMKDRKPYELRWGLVIHNILLCLLSIIMLLGVTGKILEVLRYHGIFKLYCGVNEEEDLELFIWANVFYVSKYYELLDTVFLVLRKKQLTFLHVWHHMSVIFVCWLACKDDIVMGFITSYLNCGIHVLMYYYFAMQSYNPRKDIWWRKYLTSLQIVQFLIDIFTSVFFGYFYYYGIPCK